MTQPVICFDWDGTLCDSMTLCVEELRLTLTRMGLPVPPDEVLRRCNGPTYEEAAAMIGVPADRVAEYMDIRLHAGLELCPMVNRLFPGVREMLEALKDKAALCVVSNGMRDYLELCLRSFDLEGVFLRTETFRHGRSKAQALAEVLDDLRPERVWMVGDRLGDIEAGKANGVPTVAVCYGYGTPEEWNAADRQAVTVEELSELLSRSCALQVERK
ncbi:MAG: HAD family hydrolase [Christensenellaceae bacterium]|nr:HAD family hydrolase [Christensenellaceae bacterium]